MSLTIHRTLFAFAMLACLSGTASAQSTTTSTETKKFEVIAIDGNQLVVKLPEGTREITVANDFRFNVNGQALSLQQLKPGMAGTATITTTTKSTPVTVTEVKNGTVEHSAATTIIVRTDEGFRSFSQGEIDKRGVKIYRAGKPANVSDFRPGDKISAVIITSMPPKVVTQQEVNAQLAASGGAAAGAARPPAAAPAAASGDRLPRQAARPHAQRVHQPHRPHRPQRGHPAHRPAARCPRPPARCPCSGCLAASRCSRAAGSRFGAVSAADSAPGSGPRSRWRARPWPMLRLPHQDAAYA